MKQHGIIRGANHGLQRRINCLDSSRNAAFGLLNTALFSHDELLPARERTILQRIQRRVCAPTAKKGTVYRRSPQWEVKNRAGAFFGGARHYNRLITA